MEKVRGRIAVSEDARRTMVAHLGGDAVLIPNGVRVSAFASKERLPGTESDRPRVLFLGRMDEPRKGLPVLFEALPQVLAAVPDLEVLVAGPGDIDEAREDAPRGVLAGCALPRPHQRRGQGPGPSLVHVYVAPHTGGESFGIVLVEAMAAQAAVLASDLPAFRRVLQDGECGLLFPNQDSHALAEALVVLLRDDELRAATSAGRSPGARVRLGSRRRRRHRGLRERPHAGGEGDRGPPRAAGRPPQFARGLHVTGWAILLGVIVIALLLLGAYLSMTAGRLDHLHRRIDSSWLSLDAQLLRRSSVALELASSGALDPASSLVLAEAAHEARTASDGPASDRALAESDLTAALLVALDPDDIAEVAQASHGEEMLAELDAACRRVQLSRRFLNDGVRACRQLRRQRMVRLFRLAGHTPWPDTLEMDDTSRHRACPPAERGAAGFPVARP